MNLVKLGEVAEILNGFAFKSDAFINQGTKVIRIGDINDNKVYKDNCVCIDEKTYSFPDLCRVKKDDVLMALSGATTGKIGIIDEELEGALVNQRIAIIRSQNQTTQKYIQYIFRGELLQKLLINAWGAAQPNLSSNALRSLEIPLPPIASQRRIANILDKADEIIRKRKEAIALTEQLQKSIFLDMFGDPVINPKGWEVNKVIDYCDCIVPGRDKPKSFTGSIPWITTADLKFLDKTYFSNLNMKLSENEIKEVNAKIIPKNSVLLTCVGDLGVTSIAGCDMVVNQQLHSFQCKNINNYFLMYALPYQKIFMYKRATQTTVPYMNKNTCNSIPIIYPPRKLQEKFGILIAEINNKKGLYLKALQESENLFNSLLQKAFKGEL